MTFEGTQLKGKDAILQKFAVSLLSQNLTGIWCDGSIVIYFSEFAVQVHSTSSDENGLPTGSGRLSSRDGHRTASGEWANAH